MLGISFQFIGGASSENSSGAKNSLNTSVEKSENILKNSKLDLNKATLSQLIRLPGIGPSKAKAIIDYRKKIGGFTKPEQLIEVSGIGEKTFEKLKDRLFVEAKVDTVPKQLNREKQHYKAEQDFPININTADLDSLQRLPGIGKVKAEAIIEYRESIGGFKTKEEIKKVRGIGEKTFEKIKDLIVIF